MQDTDSLFGSKLWWDARYWFIQTPLGGMCNVKVNVLWRCPLVLARICQSIAALSSFCSPWSSPSGVTNRSYDPITCPVRWSYSRRSSHLVETVRWSYSIWWNTDIHSWHVTIAFRRSTFFWTTFLTWATWACRGVCGATCCDDFSELFKAKPPIVVSISVVDHLIDCNMRHFFTHLLKHFVESQCRNAISFNCSAGFVFAEFSVCQTHCVLLVRWFSVSGIS